MKLSKVKREELERTLFTRFREEEEAQLESRLLQARDADFYDGFQLTQEEVAEMEDRGQPVLVFNEIKRAVDWISGTERTAKVDWSVEPRTDEKEQAIAKMKYMKYISDVNDADYVRSEAFRDAIIVGVGWMEEGYNPYALDEPIFVRNESWRNIWYDHLGRSPDLSDHRHIFRRRHVDLDTAIAYFPRSKAKLTETAKLAEIGEEFSVDDTMLYSSASARPMNGAYGRQRVSLIQCEYRQPVAGKFMRSDEFWQLNNVLYNEKEHAQFVEQDMVELVDSVQQQTFVCIMLDTGNSFELLQHNPNPYKHNNFSFTPIWCYRTSRNNMPYGLVRPTIDPQRDLNKRRSKALHILSTNRVIMEKGAVDDVDELSREVARSDSVVELNPGKRFDLAQDQSLANGHLTLAEQNSAMIRSAFGVTGENMGLETNASSGVAIRARQSEGLVATSGVFGSKSRAFKFQGRKLLSIVEQFVQDPKYFLITGEKEQLKINTSPNNDITARQSVFVVSEQESRSTSRMAIFEMMLELVSRISQYSPEIGVNLLDLVVEMSDIPQSRTIVERIRNMTGQDDSEEKSEEELQQEQVQAELERVAVELEMAKKKADVENTTADAQRKVAAAQKDNALTLKAKVDSLVSAIDKVPELAGTNVPELTEELMAYASSLTTGDK